MNILITGRPGAGKTTLIKEISQDLDDKAGGFYTEEIRNKGKRIGFSIKTLDGGEGVLARVDIESNKRLGKYRIDLENFESLAIPSIEKGLRNKKVIIVDEIGPMELFSLKFKEAVLEALNSNNDVVATIKQKNSSFIKKIKTRDDTIAYTLTRDNYKKIIENCLIKLRS